MKVVFENIEDNIYWFDIDGEEFGLLEYDKNAVKVVDSEKEDFSIAGAKRFKMFDLMIEKYLKIKYKK